MKSIFYLLPVLLLFANCSSDNRLKEHPPIEGKTVHRTDETAKTILLVGPDIDGAVGSNSYLQSLSGLALCLKRNHGVKAYVVNNWPSSQMLDLADAMVLYSPQGAETCLQADRQEAFQKALDRGMGLMTIHWSTALKPESEETLGTQWSEALGGYWLRSSPIKSDSTLISRVVNKHPIARGWNDYFMKDEYFLQPKLAENSKVLAQVVIDEEKIPVAWCTEWEGETPRRSFATTLGHYSLNFQVQEFKYMLVNAALWVAQRQEGAQLSMCN